MSAADETTPDQDAGSLGGQLAGIWARAMAGRPYSVLLDLGTTDDPTRDASVRVAPDRAYSGASMVKSFLAELVSEDVAAGRLDWEQPVEVRPEHLCGGDGVLPGWQMPARIALHDVTQLMVVISDNSATNVVCDVLGPIAEVNDRIAERSPGTRMRRWVGGRASGERANDPRLDQWRADAELPSVAGLSVVVPAEHHALLQRLHTDSRHEVVWAMFRGQQDRRGLVRHLDEDLVFARKTGTDQGVRHDGGILELPDGRVLAVTVFTDGTDRRESVDHPACVGLGAGMRDTLHLLGHPELVAL